MSKKTGNRKGRISDLRNMRRMQRLALIKERYRSLILEPRRRLEMALDGGEEPTEEHEDFTESYDDSVDMNDVIREYCVEEVDAF